MGGAELGLGPETTAPALRTSYRGGGGGREEGGMKEGGREGGREGG